MIDLYAASTPNGRKATIMLEEIGINYKLHKLELSAGDQRRSKFLKINPNGKIPVIIDRASGVTIVESGAILIYLAELVGKLLPSKVGPRFEVLQWLFFQVGSVGPIAGQFNHFRRQDPHDDYAISRFRDEIMRLLGVMNDTLADRSYIAGDFSIADIALVPWLRALQRWGVSLDDSFPAAAGWYQRMLERSAVRQGFDVLEVG